MELIEQIKQISKTYNETKDKILTEEAIRRMNNESHV